MSCTPSSILGCDMTNVIPGSLDKEGSPADIGDSRGPAARPTVVLVRTLYENKIALAGVAVVLLVTAFCFIGPLLYHTNQTSPNPAILNEAPSARHLLGTDYVGFDVLGRLMVAGQSSIEIALAVAVISTTFGVIWGAISGFWGGVTDAILMRIVDIVLAIPALFIFIYLASVFRPTVILLIIVVSALSWVGPARLIRGETLSLRVREYVDAVRVMGGSSGRVIIRHIVPNTISTIVVNATFQVADAILILATLSFLGFGLPPPAATWGGMLTNGMNYLYDGYWWQIYPAGLIIVITVIAFNLIGDGLRDALEVRLQFR
jgi:peptide/nickel transport system permease protein